MELIPFDDRDGTIWFDGALLPWRDARIHVLNHGLHYASCVFEGERVYDGYVFKLKEHSDRLVRSAQLLGFELPYTSEQIANATREVIVAQNIIDGYVRPVAWLGSEQMGIYTKGSKVHMAIAAWQWPSYYSPEERMRGVRMTFASWRRPAPDTAPTASKAAGLYMICTMSRREADAKGFNDALMLDYRGYIAEGTGANIYLVQNGELHTPKPDCFLDGITKNAVADMARARGMKVVERHIKPEELANTQEVFLTGTAAEITPVSQIDQYHFTPGKVTETLMQDFENAVRAEGRAAAERQSAAASA